MPKQQRTELPKRLSRRLDLGHKSPGEKLLNALREYHKSISDVSGGRSPGRNQGVPACPILPIGRPTDDDVERIGHALTRLHRGEFFVIQNLLRGFVQKYGLTQEVYKSEDDRLIAEVRIGARFCLDLDIISAQARWAVAAVSGKGAKADNGRRMLSELAKALSRKGGDADIWFMAAECADEIAPLYARFIRLLEVSSSVREAQEKFEAQNQRACRRLCGQRDPGQPSKNCEHERARQITRNMNEHFRRESVYFDGDISPTTIRGALPKVIVFDYMAAKYPMASKAGAEALYQRAKRYSRYTQFGYCYGEDSQP